jgi:hypothetical protein
LKRGRRFERTYPLQLRVEGRNKAKKKTERGRSLSMLSASPGFLITAVRTSHQTKIVMNILDFSYRNFSSPDFIVVLPRLTSMEWDFHLDVIIAMLW